MIVQSGPGARVPGWRRSWRHALAVLASFIALGAQAVPAAAHVPDYPIPSGHFFSQGNGIGGESLLGFPISDDGGIPFWNEYLRLGGVAALGFPVSKRFVWNGTVVQVLQRGVLQWDSATSSAKLGDVMNWFTQADLDEWLWVAKSIPAAAEDLTQEEGLAADVVRARRLSLLDRDPGIKQRITSVEKWDQQYGLPIVYGETELVATLRLQRVAFQRWKQDVPWAKAGAVTVANGGDLAREAGLFAPEVLAPEQPTVYRATQPERPVRMLIPKIRVNAPIVHLGISKDGSLPVPQRAGEVAWYTYSGAAGEANNSVMSGHLNWGNQSGVFARLKELVDGHEIVLVGDRGTRFVYEVLGCGLVDCHLPVAQPTHIDEFVGFSAFAHATLITCEGQFDRINRDYSHRRIVRARLVAVEGPGAELTSHGLGYDEFLFTADRPDPNH